MCLWQQWSNVLISIKRKLSSNKRYLQLTIENIRHKKTHKYITQLSVWIIVTWHCSSVFVHFIVCILICKKTISLINPLWMGNCYNNDHVIVIWHILQAIGQKHFFNIFFFFKQIGKSLFQTFYPHQ